MTVRTDDQSRGGKRLTYQGLYPADLTGPHAIATDSEWWRAMWLSTAFAATTGTVCLYFNKTIPRKTRRKIKEIVEGLRLYGEDVRVKFVDPATLEDEREWPLAYDFSRNVAMFGNRLVEMLMFFSPRDPRYSLGWNYFRPAIEKRRVVERRALRGDVVQKVGHSKTVWRLVDLAGWAGNGGLDDLSKSLVIDNASKGAFTREEKGRMLDMLNERTEDYVHYAIEDARVLLKIRERFVELVRTLERDCLGLPESQLSTVETIKMTTGALVESAMNKTILHAAGADDASHAYAIAKLGEMKPTGNAKVDNAIRAAHSTMYDEVRTRADHARLVATRDGRSLHNTLQMYDHHGTALSGGAIKTWALRGETDSAIFNAIVHGGRCNNERPDQYAIDRGADIDLSSCYATALGELTYPIGLPSSWGRAPNQTEMIVKGRTVSTLGEFLDAAGDDLVPGLWSIVVRGSLSYDQDLIASKVITAKDIVSRMGSDDDEDDDDLDAMVCLARREILNGVVTSDVWETIRAVASNREMKEIRNLEVTCAAAYLASDRADGWEDWTDVVLADRGRRTIGENGKVTDTRTRAWYGYPIRDFTGTLTERRKDYKAAADDPEKSPEERAHAKGMSDMLKLFVNTSYGVMASRFFEIGNTVVANNITARARVGVWMMAKALDLRQTITDGGLYAPGAVPTLSKAASTKLPGLAVLANMSEWRNVDKGRTLKPLGGVDWSRPLDLWPGVVWRPGTDDEPGKWSGLGEIDRLAVDHVEAFWRPYGLTLPFAVEHKTVFERAAYWAKADYALKLRSDAPNPSGFSRRAVKKREKRRNIPSERF